jgi:hypothetical protein
MTIKVNNVLMPMHPYGCHQTKPKQMPTVVSHSQTYTVNWPMAMSTKCRYDAKASDKRCAGCNKPYDDEYVDSLKPVADFEVFTGERE